MSQRTAFRLLFLVILLWGFNWPVMKIGLADIGPLTFGTLRMALGGMILLAVVAARGRLVMPSRHDLPIVFSVGIFQMAAFLILVNLGLQYVPAGRSAILAYTTSLWVVPAAMMVLGERLTPRRLAGFLLGVAGVAVMFNPLAFDWRDPTVRLGNGLLMLAALAWAMQIVQTRGHAWHATPLQLAPWQCAVGTAVMAPLAWWFEADRPIGWSTELVAVLAYSGPIATGFCFWAMMSIQRALPAITTSLGTLGTPVAGVLFSALLLGEPITPTNVAGLVLIGGGIVLVALTGRPKPP